jgi:tetrapyrrole methylase family protein/MazG family protein
MKEFDTLVKTVRILRSPQGCPWDRAQKLEDYKKHLLEEAYELIDEMNRNKFEAVKEEVGDLFLILIIITEMLREKNKFGLKDVLTGINRKLVRRHPHVFSSERLKTKEEVLAYWIKHKAKAKKRKTVKDRLPHLAPALLLVEIFLKEYEHLNLANRAAKSKLPLTLLWGLKCKINSFPKERNKKDAFSKILFELARLAHFYKVDLEQCLRSKVMHEAGRISYGI